MSRRTLTAHRATLRSVDTSKGSHGRLRIALVCPVWFPVPPTAYGGIEHVVDLLARVLVEDGHDVTLFASGDSDTPATLAAVYATAPSERIGEPLPDLRNVLACFERAHEFDVIGDHTGPTAVALAASTPTSVVHTVHGPLDGELGDAYEQAVAVSPRTRLVSLSMSQRRPRPRLPWAANCPNAIEPERFMWSPDGGEYLAFVGRMGSEKGCRQAVDVARETGLPLKIAAKCREPAERRYFERHVEPHLGKRIEYVGELGHADKAELLRGALATLFPIDWEEPFGLVMIESLACGTPVVATRRGSVPEVLDHGVTGIVVDDHADLSDAVQEAATLDRAACRRAVETRFSPASLRARYLAALRAAIVESEGPLDRAAETSLDTAELATGA